MHYQVAARKYRPQRFEELVGQPHVVQTLRKAVQSGRLAHAYLFSGPRGVGKTTTARILAKAVNCPHRTPEGEPCNSCPSCTDVNTGRSLSIIEIDAASNNSVDDVRLLRDQVRIPPQSTPYKVYIVDEVHMLSSAAFNALLKTLEEPPSYVLFIFATTEPHKVLPTILSRCQRFDFRRISISDTIARLRQVCAQEGVEIEEAALHLIARKGDGSLRDALSVLDQAISFCGNRVRYEELVRALGLVHTDYFFRVTDCVRRRDKVEVLRLVEELFGHGIDPVEFLQGLAEHLRHILVSRLTGDTSLVEASEADRGRYAELAREFEEADLHRMLHIVSDTELALKNHPQPRLKLEWALVRMASLEQLQPLEELLERLDRLERALLSRTPAFSTPPQRDPIPSPKTGAPTPEHNSPERAARSPFGPPALFEKRSRPSAGEDPPPIEGSAARKTAPLADPIPFERILSQWPEFIQHVREKSVRLAALLAACRPSRISEQGLEILTPDPFHQKTLTEQRFLLRQYLEAFFGPIPAPRFLLSEELPSPEEPLVLDPREELRRLREQYPALGRLIDRFGADPIY
jgi:DNA polymerase-3 subunit gamma/tau|nr:MAG: hypothetical protein KatS3mg041_0640 [Bacteroidota bacterium]